jgi:hypothetical protein
MVTENPKEKNPCPEKTIIHEDIEMEDDASVDTTYSDSIQVLADAAFSQSQGVKFYQSGTNTNTSCSSLYEKLPSIQEVIQPSKSECTK